MKRPIYLSLSGLVLLSLLFINQNCSNDVEFTDNAFTRVGDFDLDTVVCNPLSDQSDCDPLGEKGLIGRLYYMTPAEHGGQFGGDLNNAILQDYRTYGIQVPNLIFMNDINVKPQSWTSGFSGGAGGLVRDNDGQTLNEWFHLDLYGNLSLSSGEYEFATLSDDGMRVSFDDTVHIDHDRIHPPTWRCSSSSISFTTNQSKFIRVEYFQGPRTEIAMQLFYRLKGSGTACDQTGNWIEIPADNYTH